MAHTMPRIYTQAQTEATRKTFLKVCRARLGLAPTCAVQVFYNFMLMTSYLRLRATWKASDNMVDKRRKYTSAVSAIVRGLRSEVGNAGSRGDFISYSQFRSAHVHPPKPSPKA